jgi:hypothetical protein
MGHLGLDNMGLMISKEMVDGFPLTKAELDETRKNPDRFCELCVMANAKRAPSPTSLNPASTRILQLLHTDLARPYAVTSFNDKRYVLTVLDDYTKLSSVKCLKHKDDVAAALIHICNSLENQCRDMEGPPESRQSGATMERSTSTEKSRHTSPPKALISRPLPPTTPNPMGLLSAST